VVRVRRWIRWSGWRVVSGLAGTSLLIAFSDEVLAAIIAGLAMGGVGCLVFLDPAVERAAFPGVGGHTQEQLWQQLWRRYSAWKAERERYRTYREFSALQAIMTVALGAFLF